MPVVATSLKIPRRLKTRIDRLANRADESAHAFMLRALAGQVEAAERYQAFLKDARRADAAMLRSGLGYAAEDVHKYVATLAAGRKTQRPKPVRWRA